MALRCIGCSEYNNNLSKHYLTCQLYKDRKYDRKLIGQIRVRRQYLSNEDGMVKALKLRLEGLEAIKRIEAYPPQNRESNLVANYMYYSLYNKNRLKEGIAKLETVMYTIPELREQLPERRKNECRIGKCNKNGV